MGISHKRRCSHAGNKNVSGTDVSAPINATRSLKKGTMLATRYEDTVMTTVQHNHRRPGRLIHVEDGDKYVNSKWSKDEQIAWELIA